VHSVGNDESKAGEQIRWRNIKIQTKDLKPRPFDSTFVVNLILNTLSDQERHLGITLLWDGKTSKNRRGIYKKTFPKESWTMKDGVLTIRQSNGKQEGSGGDITTDKQYGAFELQFSFRLTKCANSGVKYFLNESYNTNEMSGIGLKYQVLDDKNHPDAKKGRDGDRTCLLCMISSREKTFHRLFTNRETGIVAGSLSILIIMWNTG
jgi:hypothetical protein